MTEQELEIVQITQRLLDSISAGDWATYAELCDPSLSAFEPEAPGQLVVGLDFHRFYFDLGGIRGPHQTTMSSPHVRLLGDVAVISYVRLIQRLDSGLPTTMVSTETRIWRREGESWKHYHFHRTKIA